MYRNDEKLCEKENKMVQNDFREVIINQRKEKNIPTWEGTCFDYLSMVKATPEIANFAPGRIYNMINDYGVTEVDESLKSRGYEDLVKYKFFEGKIFGTLEPIHDIMRFLKAAARRTETGKRILIMVGPVSSGKSTIATLIKKGLENDKTPKYAIKDCPIHEEPLHLIPLNDRPYWEEQLGVKIEGDLCPVCAQMVEEKYRNTEGYIKWEDVPVTAIQFSEQKRVGIGTFQPSDVKSQDISELIGRVNMAKMTRYGETDPRAYQFNGELQVANGGLIEYIEILKADIKFHYVLITAAQEQKIKAPGFPQMNIDTLILAHTNQTEYDTFKFDKKNEALHDRMYPVMVPWNLRVEDEILIYKKMIAESEFKNIHIAPNTLRIAAQFAILSRLVPSTKINSLIEKMKIYNGDISEEMRKQNIDVKTLREEGRQKGEGMTGISPRFIINALNVALAQKEDKNCINPVDIIRALRVNFDHHIGISEEDKQKYLTLLLGEKESVSSEYKFIAKKEVNMAFLSAYEEQAQSLFNNYIMNATAFCKKEKIKDSLTGEYSDHDEKLMRQIEEYIGIPENSKSEFRNGIFVYKSSRLENGGTFTFKDYEPLRTAIEKKLMSDLKNVVSLTIADKSANDEKTKKRRESAIDKLVKRGYCKNCAAILLAFVSEILRKES
jgi:serine protein kinase